jgi:hypothetical protein
MKNGSVSVLAVMVVAGAFAAEECADFTTGTGTNGWTVSNGVYASPLYSNAVDRISLSYSSSVATDVATVYARASGGAEAQIATLSAASSAAAIDFPDTTDFRSFRVATAGGLALKSFSALVSDPHLVSPAGVAISNNVTGTSFDASWGAVEGALGYKVYVWTNVIAGASEGTALWSETFASSPSVNNNTTGFESVYADKDGWTQESVFATALAGVVRIGSSSKHGWLASPGLSVFGDGPLTLRFTANRYSKDTGVSMPIYIVSGTTTNDLASVSLTTNSAVYHVPLPALAAGDKILFHSTTNKMDGRVGLDDVAIVQGHAQGHEEPVYIVDGLDVGGATSCELTALPSEPVLFAVEAYGRRGAASAKSEPVEVDLANPERVAVLNACLMSSLSGRIYLQGFDPLAGITSTTGDKDWLNGITLLYWQAYRRNVAVGSFKWNAGAANSGGLYALAVNQGDAGRALGGYSTKSDEMVFGMAFTNDTDNVYALSSVSYSAQQWGFKNTARQTISLSAAVVDSLVWMNAYGGEWTEISSAQSVVYGTDDPHDTPEALEVTPGEGAVIHLEPGQVLMLRWRVHSLSSGTPGMLGIDDVEVRFEVVRDRGTILKMK